MSIKKTETATGSAATPSVQREMYKTGVQPGEAVGDSQREPAHPKVTKPASDSDPKTPKGVNKEVWAQAEHAASNMGGFSGVDDDGREALIRKQYDQMIENDKNTKDWAGKDGVLGDV